MKTVILFDQYTIPVSMNRATVDTDIVLHEYHNDDRSRTCRKTLCAGCGRELAGEDIVKGYEYDERGLVLLRKEELKQIKTDSDNYILILYSTSLSQISPVYFSSSYVAVPEQGSEKTFELLRLSLLEMHKILIGKVQQGGVDSLAAVLPSFDGLLILKLYLENEISKTIKPYKKPPVMQSELDAVKSILQDMSSDFDLSVYENEYQSNLRSLIAAKIAEGKDTYSY
jgi:DNA end-binding protein Ku